MAQAHQALQWHRSHSRYGSDGNDLAAHTTPFYNGAKELQEVYMRIYAFDYKKACCYPSDFEFRKLD